MHDHESETMVNSSHPLKMGFGERLLYLDDESLDRRLGREMAEAVRNGEAAMEKYLPPLRSDRYSLEELKSDDIASFKRLRER